MNLGGEGGRGKTAGLEDALGVASVRDFELLEGRSCILINLYPQEVVKTQRQLGSSHCGVGILGPGWRLSGNIVMIHIYISEDTREGSLGLHTHARLHARTHTYTS